MKKYFYILSIALLGATACMVDEQPDTLEPVRDGKVTYIMGINCPELALQTRAAMADQPIIDKIYVAVFGGQGFLNDYAQAVPCNASGVEQASYGTLQNDQLFYYKVTLTATTSRRYIHILANGPDHLDFDYDNNIMPDLTTDAGSGAYWTMFELPTGTAEKDANGYDVQSQAAKAAFSNIKLIRNFAKVNLTVASGVDYFELTGYKVFNTPDKGRIVTWFPSYQAGASANQRLDGYYTPYVGAKEDDPETTTVDESAPMTFAALRTAGYTPSLAAGADIDQTQPTTSSDYTTGPQYVFERIATNAPNRPYIILKGKFNGGSEKYYRLDFTDKDGNYIPIFRNFQYDIAISHVAKEGYDEPMDAFNAPSNANVSALTSTASLTDLADGTSRILVQYLNKTFIYTAATPVKFQYLYMPDATATTISESTTADAKFRILSNTELAEIDGTLPNTDDPAFTVSSTSDTWGSTWNGTDKWREVQLTIQPQGTTLKRTTFRVEGTTGEGDKIYRDVTINVLPVQQYVTSVSTSGSAVTSSVTVSLTLSEGLPSSVFPLQILFEDDDKRLNPASTDMPAQVGTSITGSGERSYQFRRSISYAEYNRNHVIPCEFKRISQGSTKLYMQNEYFNQGAPYNITIPAN